MIAVVLLGHGSTDPRADLCMRALRADLQDEWPEVVVAHAYLDHCAPSLEDAVAALPRVDQVVVVPMLLSSAYHAKHDVPLAVRTLDADVTVTASDPLGPDLMLAQQALGLHSGPAVLAVGGTSDVQARAAFDALAESLSAARGSAVVVGYASQAGPDIAAAIDRAEATLVCSFTLFPGVLSDRIAAAAAAAGVPCTRPLFPEPRLRALIRERVQQARV